MAAARCVERRDTFINSAAAFLGKLRQLAHHDKCGVMTSDRQSTPCSADVAGLWHRGELHIIRVVSEVPRRGPRRRPCLKPRFTHASASGSGQDRWAAGSTTSSTYSRGASTRRGRSGRHVRAAAIFSDWLDQQHLAATDIDETLVGRFVSGLPRRPSSTHPSSRQAEVGGGVMTGGAGEARRRPRSRVSCAFHNQRLARKVNREESALNRRVLWPSGSSFRRARSLSCRSAST